MTTETERPTIAERVTAWGITWTTTPAVDNPNMQGRRDMNHWRVTLRLGRHRLTVPFSIGSALTKEPTASDVLNCLAMDSASIENANSFEDWCGEFGYDTDSRTAERTYRACERQALKLKRLLGEERYAALLWETESD